MNWPALATFDRESDEGLSPPGRLYAKSYLYIRFFIGVMGVILPAALIVLDRFFMTDDPQIRGSLSSYYHTPARDVFVAGLCIIGALLMSYMVAQFWTWDCLLSLVAGVAVTVVAFVPKMRPGATPETYCREGVPAPPGCTALQVKYGEAHVAQVHGWAALVFTAMLVALCVVFALREHRLRKTRQPRRIWLYVICGVAILGFGAWAHYGATITLFGFEWGKTYVGEIGAFGAFAISWLTASRVLLRRTRKAGSSSTPTAQSIGA